jgi:hypothetical protein
MMIFERPETCNLCGKAYYKHECSLALFTRSGEKDEDKG